MKYRLLKKNAHIGTSTWRLFTCTFMMGSSKTSVAAVILFSRLTPMGPESKYAVNPKMIHAMRLGKATR